MAPLHSRSSGSRVCIRVRVASMASNRFHVMRLRGASEQYTHCRLLYLDFDSCSGFQRRVEEMRSAGVGPAMTFSPIEQSQRRCLWELLHQESPIDGT